MIHNNKLWQRSPGLDSKVSPTSKMHLSSLVLCLCFGVLVKWAAGSDWCYTGCEHTPSHWQEMPGTSCGGKRQSPIDIDTHRVKTDPALLDFTLANFSSQHAIKSIKITGHTVKCILEENEVKVSGGNLSGSYSTIQFHLHWGDTEHHLGSEHSIDGHKYPMEMHIVSLKEGVEKPTEDSQGIAVLGFFINATEDGNMTGSWGSLTSYLTEDTEIGTEVDFNHNVSLADLIGSVNLTKFYRYMGSLTTPNCSEAVVWTVFQEPINVNKKLIENIPRVTGLANVFRPIQKLNGRQVFASPATPLPPSHSWCYDDHCYYSPSKWHLMHDAYCGGERQSPINIKSLDAKEDIELKDFNFTKFEEKHAIKYITNTGHAVKCVLKEDMLEISGGGLEHSYSTIQFHFHWGSMSHDSEGSEHTVDSHRYPMEMHIVNKRKDLSLAEAVKTPNGLAVLGFFIEASDASKSSSAPHHDEPSPSKPTSDMKAWKKLTSFLPHIKNISSTYNVTEEISIDDLLGDVNRASYFRYNGSLTTPNCNEAVVWTIFKESIKVDKDLMKMFPTNAGYRNVFRPVQPLHGRTILTTTSATSHPGGTGASKMKWLVAVFAVCTFAYTAHCAANTVAWCYHLPTCNDTTWPTIATQFCNGTRQSPIDIVTQNAQGDANLTNFAFTNYDNTDGLVKIENTGMTVKVGLKSGLQVSGGNLPETFDSLQFHLHWGNGVSTPGSEHTVNGKRYPMELHIVNSKSSLNGNTTLAVADSEGLAALGFFIEEMSGNATNMPASWHNLTSYLASIPHQGDSASIAPGFSLNDLIAGVDTSQYYRYLGSLTTPNCNEAVIWTVFKDTIKVSSDIINLFSTTVRIDNATSPFMVNVYRNVQPAQPVTTQVTTTTTAPTTTSSATKTCYSLGLMALGLALRRN
ncbi:carbonic anhydrase-like [Xyrichtys novacula]|uniref:Carbonic anhydrase n=1 Tax=Xyrichtys novacula TaxID=13765 RepID=A0AAV1H892_XYRNO|nr:carbonic anhydrase-like [Xyrichtys novacula]